MFSAKSVSPAQFGYDPSNHAADGCGVLGAFVTIMVLFGLSVLIG